jgi:YfiR/HmsC-like
VRLLAKTAWQRLLLGLGLLAIGAGHAGVPEYELKLAISYRVTKFVSWPAAAKARDAFRFCVYRGDPLDETLDDLSGRAVGNRQIEVAIVDQPGRAREACDLLFIPDEESRDVAPILRALDRAPVLTISDAPGFAESGGIIELENKNNRVAFVINVAASESAGFQISSQLLQMSELVRRAR